MAERATTALEMLAVLDPADPLVKAAGEAARQIFASIGARPFLARLDAAEAGLPVRSAEVAATARPDDAGAIAQAIDRPISG